MLKKFIAVLVLPASFLFAQAVEPYDAVVKTGDTVELSVEVKNGIKYEWADGGVGKFDPAETAKIKWTAPEKPAKTNPALITVLGKDEKGVVISTVVKKVGVFGGPIIDQPLLFYCDGPGSPRIFKASPNQLPEIKYQWEIIRGVEYVGVLPEDVNKAEAKFKTKKGSLQKEDIEIKLTYNFGKIQKNIICESLLKTFVKIPMLLKKVDVDNKVKEGPDLYGYTTVTKYQLFNQFSEPLIAEGVIIGQDITLVGNPMGISPKSIKVDYSQYVTDYDGTISSKRYLSSIFPIPADFSVKYEQDLFVNNVCLIDKIDILYKRNGVEDVENLERMTRRQRMEAGKQKRGKEDVK